mmetsp:Transcript_18039/g.53421  ORF Transcript_18039/g.53421 Transcript_18039/m.53421 type:complete len:739 (+) Transcript_18039:34-2250(+)|eukprot:CAMPEP_0182923048 /NCGR_PEP_ID=MMETSP0105_2-20130417/5185_1 /TAXON_ID=81532 ORGANISM="Acanthoeca-like sp., Strain 10tr" /NCGR_SAMPLE_ID=MMETSP0105_2 /ASSEMBLY_ACC=CAM_ASM_000205 /LENGTH=738 /DNA_ID=CAMNT_0025060725 /DNA_START=58 /DNA_END=2274 /DNA_ORIENTATION=-
MASRADEVAHDGDKKPNGWLLLNRLKSVSHHKAKDFHSQASRCSVGPLAVYITEHAKDFRLRDIAALLRACCVLYALRTTLLLRDVERELAKFFAIVDRLGRTTVGDHSLMATHETITYEVTGSASHDLSLEFDEYIEAAHTASPLQGLVIPFDPFFDGGTGAASPPMFNAADFFDTPAHLIHRSPGSFAEDETQESATRYALMSNPKAPKVSPDEALGAEEARITLDSIPRYDNSGDDDDDIDDLVVDERPLAFARRRSPGTSPSARAQAVSSRSQTPAWRSEGGGMPGKANAAVSQPLRQDDDDRDAFYDDDDHDYDNDGGYSDGDGVSAASDGEFVLASAIETNFESPPRGVPPIDAKSAPAITTPPTPPTPAAGVPGVMMSPQAHALLSSPVDFDGNTLPELGDTQPLAKKRSPVRRKSRFDAESTLPGDCDSSDDETSAILPRFAPDREGKPRLVHRTRFLSRTDARLRMMGGVGSDGLLPRVFSSMHNTKAEMSWRRAATKIMDSSPVTQEAASQESSGDDSPGDGASDDARDFDGYSAAGDVRGDRDFSPEPIELPRHRAAVLSAGRVPSFSPSSFDSANEDSFEDARRSRLPWATPRLSEVGVASSSPTGAVATPGFGDDDVDDLVSMVDLSLLEEPAAAPAAASLQTSSNEEMDNFFRHVKTFTTQSDPTTTLNEIVAPQASKTVAACAVSHLLALASMGMVQIEQAAPFGDVDITIVAGDAPPTATHE